MRRKQIKGKRKHEKGMEREEGVECGRLFYLCWHTYGYVNKIKVRVQVIARKAAGFIGG